jgi:hypothetical protein
MKNSKELVNEEQNQNSTNARKSPENKENFIPMKTKPSFLNDINDSQNQSPILSLLAPETTFFLSNTIANNTGIISSSHNNNINKIQKQVLDEKVFDLQRILEFKLQAKNSNQHTIQKLDNSLKNFQPHVQKQLLSQDVKQEEIMLTPYFDLAKIYEGILPVVEDKNINPIDEDLNTQFKLLGCFELKYVEERNLKFRIKKFFNVIYFILKKF